MLWLFFAVLAISAIAMLLYPLLRPEAVGTDRQAGAIAVLADQLREVDRDADRGLISNDENSPPKCC